MPSVSKKQERFMRAAAHDAEFASRAGISQKVAREFNRADKRRNSIKKGYPRKATQTQARPCPQEGSKFRYAGQELI